MPGTIPTSKADFAIATSAAGTYLKSQGPGQFPTMEQIQIGDIDTLSAVLDLKANAATTVNVIGDQSIAGRKTFADSLTVDLPLTTPNALVFRGHSSTNPLIFTYGGTDFGDGVIDNVMAIKWDRIAGVQAGWSENRESRFVGGSPPYGLLEWHTNYESIQGTSTTPAKAYRPSVMYMDLNTHLQYREHRVSVARWFGGFDGDIPLLEINAFNSDLVTAGNNGGVRIENRGSVSPLSVVGTSGNIDFQLNGGQFLRLTNRDTSTSSNQFINSIGILMGGSYWSGSASAGASSQIFVDVTGNNIFSTRFVTGGSDFRWRNDGKLGLNVPASKLTENIVMRNGHLAVINDFDQGPYKLIGLNTATDTTNHVWVDAGGIGTVFGGNVHFGAYGTGTGPRFRFGVGGVDNYLVMNAGSAGSSTNFIYFNLDSQNAGIEAYGQFNITANGGAGKCLAVGQSSPSGIAFMGNGVAHYGVRVTAATGLFELMSVGGFDPRVWTFAGAKLAVPGTITTATGFVGSGSSITGVVHTSGDESISGAKSFTGILSASDTYIGSSTAGTSGARLEVWSKDGLAPIIAGYNNLNQNKFLVSAAGAVSATSFSGDGSALTNLPSSGGGGGGGSSSSTLYFTSTASKTVANTTTETSIIGTGVGSLTIPANTLTPGKTYRLKLIGTSSAISGGQYRVRFKLGSVTMFDTGNLTMSTNAEQLLEIDGLITCRATGATNTVMGTLSSKQFTTTGIRVGAPGTPFALSNVDTTISNDIDITWQFSMAAVGNTMTIVSVAIEEVRSAIPSILSFVQTSNKTIANTATETSLVGTGNGSVTIPANTLVAGKTYRLRARGYFSTIAAPGSLNWRFKLGGTTLYPAGGNAPPASRTNAGWTVDAEFTCRSIGAAGTVFAQAEVRIMSSSTGAQTVYYTAISPVTVNTTTSLDIDMTIQWSTADPGNSMTTTNLTIETLNC